MNRIVSTFIISSFTFVGMSFSAFGKNIYQDPSRSVEERVSDLMSRMTLEEKVGQMCQWVGLEHMRTAAQDLTVDDLNNNTARGFYPGITEEDVEQMTIDGKIGSFLHVLTVKEANQLQELARKSRLKIPLIIGIDAIHGNAQVVGTTAYPTSIGQASMFDVDLVEEICRQTALEMRATGSQWTFNPNVEVARDPRWGRVGETFGEDPYLVSLLGAASVRGYQGNGFGNAENVLACAKHFIGGSQPINGTNGSPTDISERTLREVFFPPFKATVDAGVYSFMTAHNELNGIPCHANPWLMEDILRKEWGFKGMVVTDNYCGTWMNPTKAIMAGTDLILSNAAREVEASVASTDEGISAMKTACKNILYTISDAAGKREIAARAGFDWWGLTYISTQIIFYGCAALFAIIAYMKYRKWLKNAVTVEVEENK